MYTRVTLVAASINRTGTAAHQGVPLCNSYSSCYIPAKILAAQQMPYSPHNDVTRPEIKK